MLSVSDGARFFVSLDFRASRFSLFARTPINLHCKHKHIYDPSQESIIGVEKKHMVQFT